MLKRFDVEVKSNPVCSKPIYNIVAEEFRYYDKDGFELNLAEEKFYHMMGYPVNGPILNHTSWQEPWFELEDKNSNLILDHCMLLYRASYTDHAEYQLNKVKKDIPEATWLLNTPQKWGFDFALDAVDPSGNIYEVIHIEYDHLDYDNFMNKMRNVDYTIRHTDWKDAAERIYQHRDEWKNLKGFAQNDWKANFLVGWKRAEYTEKSLTL